MFQDMMRNDGRKTVICKGKRHNIQIMNHIRVVRRVNIQGNCAFMAFAGRAKDFRGSP